MRAARPPRGRALDVEFDALAFGRLTWMGLVLAALGWALLLGEATVADIMPAKTPRPLGPAFHADLIDIAKTIIASGFGLAIIGALQSGFGTLNRFFGAVLNRSGQRRQEEEGPRQPVEPPPAPPSPRKPAMSIDSRPYRLLPDGSVEVETILGTRVFKTMAEAREFI